jgi:hypothetical protein
MITWAPRVTRHDRETDQVTILLCKDHPRSFVRDLSFSFLDPNGDSQNGYAVGIIPACVSDLHILVRRDLADHEQRLVPHTTILWVGSFVKSESRVATNSSGVSF